MTFKPGDRVTVNGRWVDVMEVTEITASGLVMLKNFPMAFDADELTLVSSPSPSSQFPAPYSASLYTSSQACHCNRALRLTVCHNADTLH